MRGLAATSSSTHLRYSRSAESMTSTKGRPAMQAAQVGDQCGCSGACCNEQQLEPLQVCSPLQQPANPSISRQQRAHSTCFSPELLGSSVQRLS